MSRNLTEKQQTFLNVLFEEAQGDPTKAKKLAGYGETVATSSIVNVLQDEIAERTKKFISSTATKAAYSMKQIMESPTDLGNKEKMAAAKDILDRGGFKASDKVEVSTSNPLFILPPKDD
tara:strand:+ start:486 stop:845 length:360 start_codon:yes stop_codon:yes gene_type:complete